MSLNKNNNKEIKEYLNRQVANIKKIYIANALGKSKSEPKRDAKDFDENEKTKNFHQKKSVASFNKLLDHQIATLEGHERYVNRLIKTAKNKKSLLVSSQHENQESEETEETQIKMTKINNRLLELSKDKEIISEGVKQLEQLKIDTTDEIQYRTKLSLNDREPKLSVKNAHSHLLFGYCTNNQNDENDKNKQNSRLPADIIGLTGTFVSTI